MMSTIQSSPSHFPKFERIVSEFTGQNAGNKEVVKNSDVVTLPLVYEQWCLVCCDSVTVESIVVSDANNSSKKKKSVSGGVSGSGGGGGKFVVAVAMLDGCGNGQQSKSGGGQLISVDSMSNFEGMNVMTVLRSAMLRPDSVVHCEHLSSSSSSSSCILIVIFSNNLSSLSYFFSHFLSAVIF
jgi:hypothetical protein